MRLSPKNIIAEEETFNHDHLYKRPESHFKTSQMFQSKLKRPFTTPSLSGDNQFEQKVSV